MLVIGARNVVAESALAIPLFTNRTEIYDFSVPSNRYIKTLFLKELEIAGLLIVAWKSHDI